MDLNPNISFKALNMKPNGPGRLEALGMESSEGEYVQFGNPVLLEGICQSYTD